MKVTVGKLISGSDSLVQVLEEHGSLIQRLGKISFGKRVLSIPESFYLCTKGLLQAEGLEEYLASSFESYHRFFPILELLEADMVPKLHLHLVTLPSTSSHNLAVLVYPGLQDDCSSVLGKALEETVIICLYQPSGSIYLQLDPFTC